MEDSRSRLKIVLIGLPVVVVALGTAVSTYVKVKDELAQYRVAIDAQWAGVDSAFAERAGRIRDLANAAKASRLSAGGVFAEVAAAQAELLGGATPQARIRANDRLSEALAKLMVYMESDRRAAADGNFSRIEDGIKDSEARVAVARLKYNETLEHYNARIQKFPQNLVARIAGFARNDAYFYTEPF
ncbi:MAG TPA: LemA family protein [Bryobacteraceae bacterium]|nr:LemA family protein [Bryobacteraceae bacterium]